MQKLAKVRRLNKDGSVQNAAVNTALVRYVVSHDPGAYIAFDDTHTPEKGAVTPVGILSPDTVKDVIRRLNRPYLLDVGLRVGAIIVSAIVVFSAIWVSQCG